MIGGWEQYEATTFAVARGAWQNLACHMHIPSLIEHKRDGGVLSSAEIQAVIGAFTRGDMPEYQMSALAMAIFFRGMTPEETAELICVTDPAMLARMRETGAAVKRKVYDNRIVTFAPLRSTPPVTPLYDMVAATDPPL